MDRRFADTGSNIFPFVIVKRIAQITKIIVYSSLLCYYYITS